MLQDFFGRSAKQPDTIPSQDIFVYAHSPGLSGKQPSAITIGARIACISSFFRFLIRMDIAQSNPCDKLQRPQTSPSTPRGLSGDQVHQLLEVVPNSPLGSYPGDIKPGYYSQTKVKRLITKFKDNPEALHFLRDMLEE